MFVIPLLTKILAQVLRGTFLRLPLATRFLFVRSCVPSFRVSIKSFRQKNFQEMINGFPSLIQRSTVCRHFPSKI